MLGLAGSNDMRDIGQALAAGDARATLAYDLYCYRIRQYIGAYAATLNGLDAIVFTAGVGENDALVRARVCQNMEFFGLQLDEAKNQERTPGLRDLSGPESRVRILIIPTNEELEIARQCTQLLANEQVALP
jgi:acetate kinase